MEPIRNPTPNVNPGQKPYRERYPEPRLGDNGNTGNGGVPRDNASGGSAPGTVNDKPVVNNRETPSSKNPESTGKEGTSTEATRPVRKEPISSKPIETKSPATLNSGSTASEPVKPVKTPEPYKEPEVTRTRPVYTEPIKTEPVKTETRYTPPPSKPVSNPVQRPVSAPVSTPSSTPSKPITSPGRRGG